MQDTHGGGRTPLQRSSRCNLQPQPTGQSLFRIAIIEFYWWASGILNSKKKNFYFLWIWIFIKSRYLSEFKFKCSWWNCRLWNCFYQWIWGKCFPWFSFLFNPRSFKIMYRHCFGNLNLYPNFHCFISTFG